MDDKSENYYGILLAMFWSHWWSSSGNTDQQCVASNKNLLLIRLTWYLPCIVAHCYLQCITAVVPLCESVCSNWNAYSANSSFSLRRYVRLNLKDWKWGSLMTSGHSAGVGVPHRRLQERQYSKWTLFEETECLDLTMTGNTFLILIVAYKTPSQSSFYSRTLQVSKQLDSN